MLQQLHPHEGFEPSTEPIRPRLVTATQLRLWLWEVAQLRVSRSSLTRWRLRGLPCYRLSTRVIRYSPEEVLNWVYRHREEVDIDKCLAQLQLNNRKGGR